ncbi:MAG: HAMP domain-containing sensor histidine kinase [Pseudomonadota bacterium]
MSPLHLNLHRLLVIRAIVFVLQLGALLYARYVLALALDYVLIIGILVLLAIANGGLLLRLQRARSPDKNEFFAHLLIDVLGLGLLLYFAGGATNPFISYLLVPVTIAAAALPGLHAVALGAIALACYSLLLFFYQPLPELMPVADEHAGHAGMASTTAAPNLHSVGMWFNFAVSAALVIYFVVKLAAELRQREAKLQQYREETLRNEQILAVATQAAGTAHALGTPLGTMAVLLGEMAQENTSNVALAQDICMLQSQLAHCRRTLQQLVQKADFKQLQIRRLPLTDFIAELLQQWQLLRPEVTCKVQVATGISPTLQLDPTLEQALINLLNNAADASPDSIAISVDWQPQHWRMQIRDHGPGVARELQEQLGTTIQSSKPDGMGVGLVLSQATLNRLGGSVSLYPQQPHGTLTVIELPLEPRDD